MVKVRQKVPNMSTNQKHHEDVVLGLYCQLEVIFDSSEQSILLYLDETHKFCNGRFASLLGYSSPNDLMKNENFMEIVADSYSRRALNTAFQDVYTKKNASTINVKWKGKTGSSIDTTAIIVPVSFENHLLALCYIIRRI